MARWFVAFALAVAVPGGPLLADVCAAACPRHHSRLQEPQSTPCHHDGSAAGDHESLVGSPLVPPTADLRARPISSGCVHLDVEITDARQGLRLTVVKAAVIVTAIAPQPDRVFHLAPAAGRRTPLEVARPISQLRI